jgi:thymidine kinase
MLASHDKIMIPCLNVDNLSSLWFTDHSEYKFIRNAEVILINEGQFFRDLHYVVNDMLKNNKVVYVCGLDGDFERKRFGELLDLIPLCDKVTKLTSLLDHLLPVHLLQSELLQLHQQAHLLLLQLHHHQH